MKKRIYKVMSLLLAFTLILSLVSCGSNSSDSPANSSAFYEAATEPGVYESDAAWDEEESYGYYDEAEPGMAAESSATGTDSSDVTAAMDSTEVKMIYTAHLELEVLDLNEAVSGLNQLVAQMGGYYQSSDRNGSYGNYRYANFTVRIPVEHYREFVDAWSNSENCKLTSAREDAEDVGTRYFDIETRLETLRNKMDRLQVLLEQATEMEDIIYIENAISETEYEIELYSSDLNRYDSLINFSTVYISMKEVVKLAEQEQPTFAQRLGQNFQWGLDSIVELLQDLALSIAYNFVGILIFVIVIVVIIVALRKSAKRKGTKLQGKTEDPKADDKKE